METKQKHSRVTEPEKHFEFAPNLYKRPKCNISTSVESFLSPANRKTNYVSIFPLLTIAEISNLKLQYLHVIFQFSEDEFQQDGKFALTY